MRITGEWLRGAASGLAGALLATGLILLVARPPTGQPVTLQPPPEPARLSVHLTGAVSAPGVYALPPGSLLRDALDAAGGPTADADLSLVNLAEPLIHGTLIRIPARPTPTPPPPTLDPRLPTPIPATTAPTTAPSSGLVNINTASAEALDTLPGIGPGLAQRIIEYRNTHGAFARIEDLMNVSGIGPATFEKLKDKITVR